MSNSLFVADLEKNLRGEVLSDPVSLGIYSTDASLYQIQPLAIVLPLDEGDLKRAVQIAHDHQVSIVPRGGGTGLAGQTIGTSMIVDFSKHLNTILEINETEKWVRMQPGLARDNLNAKLAPLGLEFAPDPATSSRANIGGMVGNNSSGTKSILYGKTVDHVLEMRTLLSDGTELHLKKETPESFEQIAQQNDREGELFAGVKKIVTQNQEEIRARFPKVMRRVGGYNLDEFIDTPDWNLAKLVCGSEGTLATILEVKLNLVDLPKCKGVCLGHYSDLQECIRAVQTIVKHGPAAVEIIDDTVIQLSRTNLTTARSTHVVEGDPTAILIIEFYDDSQEQIERRAKAMIAELQAQQLGYAYPIHPEGLAYHDVWTIRKKGLGLMLGMKSARKPIAFIEDAAIPLEHLPNYIAEVRAVCDKYETAAAMYAHASVGVIHVRPILDMRDQADIDRFKNIAEETFQLVVKYGGSWSGEHGDGLVRSPFNERFFGTQLYQAFQEIKNLFDPAGLMNPGKIVNAPPIDHNLRYGSSYQDQDLKTHYHFRQDGSFHNAVHLCSGVGECRKTLRGTMCPSFMATRDEEHSTRGRANALRLAMSGQLEENLTDPRVLETLDLCLSCKACKSECPSNVDMAKLKSEVWQMKYDAQGPGRREKFIRDSNKMANVFSGRAFTSLINGVQRSAPFRAILGKVAGIEPKRILPAYAKKTFLSWYKSSYVPPQDPIGSASLFLDTYIKYHEPSVGIGVANLLSSAGFALELADVGCCQRPRISNGFLRLAKKDGKVVADHILNHASHHPVIVCEPSCASALHDDLPDLLDDPTTGERIKKQVFTLADFVSEHIDHFSNKTLEGKKLLLHGHCHEKALYGTATLITILEGMGAEVEEVDAGCCGMAGSFGYEKEHYELSRKIGAQRLFPAVEKVDPDTIIISNGFSCRHQIDHFTSRESIHWAQLFA